MEKRDSNSLKFRGTVIKDCRYERKNPSLKSYAAYYADYFVDFFKGEVVCSQEVGLSSFFMMVEDGNIDSDTVEQLGKV